MKTFRLTFRDGSIGYVTADSILTAIVEGALQFSANGRDIKFFNSIVKIEETY